MHKLVYCYDKAWGWILFCKFLWAKRSIDKKICEHLISSLAVHIYIYSVVRTCTVHFWGLLGGEGRGGGVGGTTRIFVPYFYRETTSVIFSLFPRPNRHIQNRVCSWRKKFAPVGANYFPLTLLHSEWSKLHRVLAVLSVIGLRVDPHREERQKWHWQSFFPCKIISNRVKMYRIKWGIVHDV